MIPQLSVIGRQCIAAICVERFCRSHGIATPLVTDFVEHLWAIATVDEDSFVEWEQRFQKLPASTWADDSAALHAAIPASLLEDYATLADAAVECSAATWYGSDIPATIAAFDTVLRVMHEHKIALPNFELFRSSSPALIHGWGNKPTADQLRLWKTER